MGKIKIFNDPVYGFLRISNNDIFSIIEHPYFQRLRRIKQLGLSDLVYPGAHHSRFHHTLGAVHLMEEAIDNLRIKGIKISTEEANAVTFAILLHDIGHGPFSHALEHSILENVSHEDVSLEYMHYFNRQMNGKLDLAIEIFKGNYHRKFLKQLVSGQIDIDRLDYLRRDSFYTGVSEGIIGSDRIIKMMNVVDDELVVDEKGIYSIEKFLIARNLMYWQVYLHKTVIGAEALMVKIVQRAKKLFKNNQLEVQSNSLAYFFKNSITIDDFKKDKTILHLFSQLDDIDLMCAFKNWMHSSDLILSELCQMLVNRRLFKIKLQSQPFSEAEKEDILLKIKKQKKISHQDALHFCIEGKVQNTTYHSEREKIKILFKTGKVMDFSQASEQYDLNVLNKEVQKYYICLPKLISQ